MKQIRDIDVIQMVRAAGIEVIDFAPNGRDLVDFDLDWFKAEFIPYHRKHAIIYAPGRWICWNQAWQAKNIAHELHALSSSVNAAIAFGFLTYTPDVDKIPPGYDELTGHAINFLISNDTVHFYDATKTELVDLTDMERGTVDFLLM